MIGNLSSSSYEYSAEEVEKIFTTLQETLDKAKARFSPQRIEKQKFQL